MTRRKREIVGLMNERDFPYLVEFALPPGGLRSVFQEIDAFHRERRIPVLRGQSRHEVKQFYSILLPRHRHCGCIPQSLRRRMLHRPPKKNGVKEDGDDHDKNSLHLPRRYVDP